MTTFDDLVRNELERIIDSESFRNARRLRAFLRFIVEETLAGRSTDIKEYTIGVAVCGRPESFDPKLDPIVRVDATRLRSRLGLYYQTEANGSEVRIDLPKGRYVPTFRRIQNDSAAKLSLAVLPFANLGSPDDQEHVSDSLTEELIRSLVSIGNLNVIGRSSVFQFKTGDGDSRTVGKSLGVDYVLEGTLRINNGRIQITAKLIHVQRAWILWSEKYACDWSGILSIQDQITASVTDALKIRVSALDGTTLFAHVTEQPEAYADYLRGRYFWNQRTPTALRASIHFYEKAIERDASCGPAYAGIASTLTTIAINDQEPTLAIADRARAAAQRALELRPDWAEALAAMGCVHSIFDWNWKDAALHFEEAIRRQPGSSAVHYLYAIFNLTPTGRWSEAIGLMEEALRLDPISPLLFRDLGLIHFMRHAFQEAESAWQQAELLVPGYLGCLYWRARLQMETGEFGEAMRDLEKRFACGGDLIIACWPLSVMPQRDWVMWTELYRY